MIQVVDLFAGPGGLGEGFSAFQTRSGRFAFQIALSIEKDPHARRTLALRRFFRQFAPGDAPPEYYEYLRRAGEAEEKRRRRLFDAWPHEAERAEQATLLAELGVDDPAMIRGRIAESLQGQTEFVLLGGPPCQAYSVMGRSRNSGNPKYRPAEDKRQRLYVEYLQVLADHHPVVFVMENVKGLLSATLENQRIFDRILDDLRSPCEAVLRENRGLADGRRRTRYRLLAIGCNGNGDSQDLRRFIVRMEKHGIPQARHRLIIIGIRTDLRVKQITPLPERGLVETEKVISDLPPVRSGLSREEDSIEKWKERIAQIRGTCFMNGNAKEIDQKFRNVVSDILKCTAASNLSRGGEFIRCRPATKYRTDWYIDPQLGGVCNHTTRSHIPADLQRYLYAACYADTEHRSPDLRDFPAELLPSHRNARRAAEDGTFDDRFHVQLLDRPSTTVTSHLAKDGHYFIHPDACQCRSMTVREVARLQTFPDNYFFCGPRTAQYIQVGNAVPPLLAHQIAGTVFKLLTQCGLTE
jgi:DNA (cytosine-5)-methyltransferase 1